MAIWTCIASSWWEKLEVIVFHRQDEAPREKEIPSTQQQVPHSKFHAEIRYEMMPWAVSHALFQTFLRRVIKIK